MLELDILLARFWQRFGDALDTDEEAALERLLAYEDNDLLAWVLGKAVHADPFTVDVLKMLRMNLAGQSKFR